MKAIGKRSLASILSAGLHVARIVIFAGFVGLSIAAVVLPFLPMIGAAIADRPHVDISGDLDISGGDYVELMGHFVMFGVALFVVNRLLEILRTLRFGTPFVKENAVRFRNVGYALLLAEGAKIAFSILGKIFDADVDMGLSFMAWVSIVAVFVLSEVFLEGAKMKEDQDLTV